MDNDKPKLHLACGKNKLPGWINIDIEPESAADLQLDLTQDLPFESSSVQFIYSEHFIEHISRDQAVNLLKECYRLLVPGGILRLSTPDLNFLVLNYITGEVQEWGSLWQPGTSCNLMNEGMRAWGHQFLYNSEELFRVLEQAGFHLKQWVNWGESSHKELNGLESRPYHQEIIIEACKLEPQAEYDADQDFIHRSHLLAGIEKTIAAQDKHILCLEQELQFKRNHIKELEKQKESHVQQLHHLEKMLDKIKNFMAVKPLKWFYKELR